MPPTPDPPDRKVATGLQTIAGYGTAYAGLAAAIVLAILQANDAGSVNLPPWLYGLLLAASAALTAITGRNRSEQAVAKEHAAAYASVAAELPGIVAPEVDAAGYPSPSELAAAIVREVRAQDAGAGGELEDAEGMPEPDGTYP